MPVTRIDIVSFLALAGQHPVLDVRSPGEYYHAHIPGAISFPLFSDEERKIVGTTYKQQSREEAIKIGLDFFGPTMKDRIVAAEKIANGTKTLLVHCWRGGMRSGAIAWLLDLYGFKIYTLAGGYKAYRNWVLSSFKKEWPIAIIGGYTGSGKTELLQSLEKEGERVIDLETIASHKGSAFGSIGMPPQPGQEQFENNLATQLANFDSSLGNTQVLWMEDESQRIGLVNIPGDLWSTMRRSPVYFLDIPFEKRLEHIVEEYGVLDKQKLMDSIDRITKKLGHLQAQQAKDFLAAGNINACFEILLRYYDKLYEKSLHNREGLKELLIRVSAEETGAHNKELLLNTEKNK
jgi:tRNA 2-selenouridine synthase